MSQLLHRKRQFLSWGPCDDIFRMFGDSFSGGARFTNFEARSISERKALAEARHVVEGTRAGLYLSGHAGTGKTHLAAAIFNELLCDWQPPGLWAAPKFRFIAETDLFAQLRASFGKTEGAGEGDSERQILNSYCAPELLLLDDVCRHRPADTAYRNRVYFHLLDHRWASKKGLVLTTNLSESDMTNELGEAIMDRIGAICGKQQFILSGRSHR